MAKLKKKSVFGKYTEVPSKVIPILKPDVF
jgi:hypothetical protein